MHATGSMATTSTEYARDEEYEDAIAQLIANREQAAILGRPPQHATRTQPCRPPLNTLSVSRTTARTPRCGFPANVSEDFFSSQQNDHEAAQQQPPAESVTPAPVPLHNQARKRPIADVFPKSAEDDWRA